MNTALKSTGFTLLGWLAMCAVLVVSFLAYAEWANAAAGSYEPRVASAAEKAQLAVMALTGAGVALGVGVAPFRFVAREPVALRRILTALSVVVTLVALFYYVAFTSFANCCIFNNAFPYDTRCWC